AWQGDLLSVEFADTIQRIDLLRRFVRTDAQNSRKPKRESAFVPLRLLHVVESHFEHDFWLDDATESLIFNSMRQKIVGKFADFGVGEAGIGLTDIEQMIAFAHRKRVFGKHSVPLAMAIFHSRYDHV